MEILGEIEFRRHNRQPSLFFSIESIKSLVEPSYSGRYVAATAGSQLFASLGRVISLSLSHSLSLSLSLSLSFFLVVPQ